MTPTGSDATLAAPVVCVVGSGGLLGAAVTRSAAVRGAHVLTPAVRWAEPAAAIADLRRAAGTLLDTVEARPDRAAAGPDTPESPGWQLVWCAGAGVAGTTAAELEAEVRALEALLAAVAEGVGRRPDLAASGAVFVASSVGGVYGGVTAEQGGPPFTEAHPVAATSDYGRAKLAAERVAGEFADRTGVRVVVGRITNLYGPGQDLAKPQGLISHLCRAHLTRSSVSVYVSLDTIRDYLYVDDCADLVLDLLDRVAVADVPAGSTVVKIVGAQQGVTIGALLGEFRRVFKRAPLVLLGESDLARYQARDLRVRSVVWPEVDQRPLTGLPVGLAATAEDLYRTVKGAV